MIRLLTLIVFLISLNSFAYTVMPAKKHSQITGYTRAANTMTITAETSGRLTKVNLAMGDISDGGVFAVIDPTFTNFSIKSIKTSIKKLDASIKRLENSRDYLKKEFSRVESLYLSEVETESRRDGAKNSFDQAELTLAELQADRESLKVSLAELIERNRRNYIRIPSGWQVTTKPLEVGELVNPGQTIAKAGDYRSLIVPLFVDNEQLNFLKSKPECLVTVDGKPAKATVKRVNPAFDERTRKRQIELSVDMFGVGGLLVQVPMITDAEGLMVDKRAVNERYANPRVVSNGREIKVTIIGRDGDMVLIAPNEKLQAGMELEAVR